MIVDIKEVDDYPDWEMFGMRRPHPLWVSYSDRGNETIKQKLKRLDDAKKIPAGGLFWPAHYTKEDQLRNIYLDERQYDNIPKERNCLYCGARYDVSLSFYYYCSNECTSSHYIEQHENNVMERILYPNRRHFGLRDDLDKISGIQKIVGKAKNISQVGVYFLTTNRTVWYVGQTTKLRRRLAAHSRKNRRVVHDSAYFLPANEEHLKSLEETFIRYFRPPFNQQHNLEPSRDDINKVFDLINYSHE